MDPCPVIHCQSSKSYGGADRDLRPVLDRVWRQGRVMDTKAGLEMILSAEFCEFLPVPRGEPVSFIEVLKGLLGNQKWIILRIEANVLAASKLEQKILPGVVVKWGYDTGRGNKNRHLGPSDLGWREARELGDLLYCLTPDGVIVEIRGGSANLNSGLSGIFA